MQTKFTVIRVMEKLNIILWNIRALNSGQGEVSSSAHSKRCGILISLFHILHIKDLASGDDNVGRFYYLKARLGGHKLLFVSAYGCNPYRPSFFPDLTGHLVKFSDCDLLSALM
uniref:Uncharacterized protein n=1 Tax=Erpetoichthys calabaricus TaxID=27687 RepID=A0A8C4SMB6_ERPCA